jgi:hypothetical protein
MPTGSQPRYALGNVLENVKKPGRAMRPGFPVDS